MKRLLFPDNTVLINFVVMGREDLFEELAGGQGTWTVTIAGECRRSAVEPGLHGLERLAEVLGEPLLPTLAERVDSQLLRARLAKIGEGSTQHLGEAEILAVIAARQLPAVFVTDDRAAQQLAGSSLVGVQSVSTYDLLRLAVRTGRLTADTAWALVGLLKAKRRGTSQAPKSLTEVRNWVN